MDIFFCHYKWFEWYTKICVFILEQFYKMNNISSKPFHLKKNQFFHNRGWIASNFKVKTSAISLAKLKQKQFQRSLHQIIPLMPIHTRSMEVGLKPTTATIKSENMSKMEMVESDQLSAFNTMFQMKSSNFKTSVGNKKSLLFMRPYTKDRTVSMTIDEKKSQVYQQINNPDVLLLSDYFNKKGVIEYLTQYKESYSTQISKEKARPKTSSKRCMNVLKEKLKKKCEMTSYQSKMKGLKYQ